ncbi:armadillo-type protein [Cyathus striatus]|nr:armadillo-type protein [Cyathus striatus]
MGFVVSLLRDSPPSMHSPPSSTAPPSHIPLPPPPVFSSFAAPADPSPADPLQSPYLHFHTAPSSPYVDNPQPSPSIYFTPPTSPYTEAPLSSSSSSSSTLHPSPASPSPSPSLPTPPDAHEQLPDDAFPALIDLAVDLPLDDEGEGLSTLEKIYLFSRSQATFHRVFIAHALPTYLEQVSPQEATEYVLPLLKSLAMDQEEQVKEALAAELVPVIWWFFSHCQIIPDELKAEETYASSSTTVTISVQAFTPILGTLLLSPNPLVGGAARFAVVDLLSRMKRVDDKESGISTTDNQSCQSIKSTSYPYDEESDSDDSDDELPVGLFKREERAMFQQEILQQVIIGMGRLDVDVEMDIQMEGSYLNNDYGYESWDELQSSENDVEVVAPGEQGNGEEGVSSPRELKMERQIDMKEKERGSINPYFPVLPASFTTSPPSGSASSTPPSTNSTPSTYSSSGSSPAASVTNRFSPIQETPAIPHSRPLVSPSLASTSRMSSDVPEPVLPSSKRSTPSATNALHPEPSLSDNLTSANIAKNEETLQHSMGDRWAMGTDPNRLSPPLSPPAAVSPGAGPTHPGFLPREEYPYNGSDMYETENGDDEQAAVGRLSSMSLMAAVAASGSLGEDTKHAFVKEVERVGHDNVYWVRREASFALGALAKVVPDEIIISSLLPLFETLWQDGSWHVRHSVLYALPALLSRLSPEERRKLALKTIKSLSSDKIQHVRSGVLEALGEVIYTFHDDPNGPPDELLHLFLGRKEDRRVRDGQQELESYIQETRDPLLSFFQDPERPLICAFNFPAVALTLGGERWGELRTFYLDIAANRNFKVRKTLAASLGELAKIIGQKHACNDLVGVWWDSIRCEDEEVRTKAIESLELLIGVLDVENGSYLVQGLLTVWDEQVFRGWRERGLVIRGLVRLTEQIGQRNPAVIKNLLLRGLGDNAAAVRESAISILPQVWNFFSSRKDVVDGFREDLAQLARSTVYRKRMTFVACQQALLTSADQFESIDVTITDVLDTLIDLSRDRIDGVRIAVSRFIGIICEQFRASSGVPEVLNNLVRILSADLSSEVRSYIPDLAQPAWNRVEVQPSGSSNKLRRQAARLATFSRPPRYHTPIRTKETDQVLYGTSFSASSTRANAYEQGISEAVLINPNDVDMLSPDFALSDAENSMVVTS